MKTHARSLGFRLASVFVFAAVAASAQVDGSRNVQFLANRNDYPGSCANGWKYASCWSYIHGDGREYAAIGTCSGVLIYNLVDPSNPILVANIPGVSYDIHHEMKSYGQYLYVVAEGPTDPLRGLQVIGMADPDSPQLIKTYTETFETAHTVTLDAARGLLFCNGTRKNGVATGMRILSLADPKNPTEVGWWPGGSVPVPPDDYVHDSWVEGELVYVSTHTGTRVLDVLDPSRPVEIAPLSPFGTHSTSSHGNRLYLCDETPGQPLRTLFLNELTGTVVSEFKPIPQPNIAEHVIHNPRVKGDELYLSSYIEGVRVLDISDPSHPAEFGWVDSYLGDSPRWYYSVWEVCPYYPSGIMIASDTQTGLYVYRPIRNYGIIRVVVRNATTGYSLPGATVRLTTQGDVLTTLEDGIVQFAPSPGSHSVYVSKTGYVSASATRTVSPGSRDTVTIALAPSGGGGGGQGQKLRVIHEGANAGVGHGGLAFGPPAPNPSRGRVSFELSVPVERLVDVEVLDLAGRCISALHRGPATAGRLVLEWDGRDRAGRLSPAGMYLVRARSGDERVETRFVRLQ